MNFVTSHPTISPKLTLSGKFWLRGFDLGENTFLSDFPHFSFLFHCWVEQECHHFVRDLQLTGRTRPIGENCSWETSARTRGGPSLSAQCLQLCVSVSATEESYRVRLALAISMLASWQISSWKSIWVFSQPQTPRPGMKHILLPAQHVFCAATQGCRRKWVNGFAN